MNDFTTTNYRARNAEEQIRIMRDHINGDGNKDILNLEYIIYSIMPNSTMWRMGCVKTLRKAIELLKKEEMNDLSGS